MNGVAYIMVVLGILLAKGIGFLRDIVFASVFGANDYTDMYFQIFGLVNLIFTGIGVALSTLVIKNMNKEQYSGHERQKAYVARFITNTSLVIIPVTIVMYICARLIVRILLPGLRPELIGDAVKLVYIMLPSFLFVVVAYIISGVLQNNKVFFISSIMSLPFNCVIIASLFVKNVDIMTVGIVTTIGWFLHIAIQLPAFYKKDFKLFAKPDFSLKGGANAEVVYIFISNMMFQLCFLIDKAFVTGDSGAASTINYSSNLFITISSVFVVAMSNVCFPSISRNYEEGNIEYVKKLLQHMITMMFAIFVPFILTVCCFGDSVIKILYERGEFTSELTHTTALLFAVYTLGALGYVCQELFNKVLYLDSKYLYTVAGTIAVVAMKPLVNIFAAQKGVVAVAVTTAVLLTVYAVIIALAMAKVVGNYADLGLVKDVAKIILAGGAAFVAFLIMKITLPEFTKGDFTFIVPLGVCGAVYLAVLIATGIVKKITGKISEQ